MTRSLLALSLVLISRLVLADPRPPVPPVHYTVRITSREGDVSCFELASGGESSVWFEGHRPLRFALRSNGKDHVQLEILEGETGKGGEVIERVALRKDIAVPTKKTKPGYTITLLQGMSDCAK